MTPSRKRLLKRIPAAILVVAGILLATGAALYLCPEPLFAYHADCGNLTLYCDTPFDPQEGVALLQKVDERLETSPIYKRGKHFRVFVCNKNWHRILYFLPVPQARGLSYMSSTAVFLSGGDIRRNLMIPPNGMPDETGPALSYYAAHEISHVETEHVTGPIDYLRLPDWIREGYVDYVARGSLLSSARMREAFLTNAPEMNFPTIAPYLRYNLLVAHYLETRRMTPEQLFDAAPDQLAAEDELRKELEN